MWRPSHVSIGLGGSAGGPAPHSLPFGRCGRASFYPGRRVAAPSELPACDLGSSSAGPSSGWVWRADCVRAYSPVYVMFRRERLTAMSNDKRPTTIADNSGRLRWVNSYNLLKLTGLGGAIASCLDHAISKIADKHREHPIVELRKTIVIQIAPSWLSRKQNYVEIMTLEATNHAESGDAILSDNDCVVYLDAKRRPITMLITNVPNDSEAEPNVEFVIHSPRDQEGPIVEYITVSMREVVQCNNIAGNYVVYSHSIGPRPGVSEFAGAAMSYVGVTRQGWRKRFSQHLSNAMSGSPLLFHRALREHYAGAAVVQHRILGVFATEREAMDEEEAFVNGVFSEQAAVQSHFDFVGLESWATGTLYPNGLNMIPGGYAGLRALHKMGALADREVVDVERREERLINIMKRPSLEGKPNPLLAAHWQNEDYATRIICGPEGRLRPEQISQARFLYALGRNKEEITQTVGARSVDQIARLLAGKTYSRIRS